MSGRGWEDIWNLAMAMLGRESVEVQILIWLAVALAAAVFIEGLRSTFFPHRVRTTPVQSEASSQSKIHRVRGSQARLWRVVEIAREADGAPGYVAALPQTARNPRRRGPAIRRGGATRPGIHRRPALALPDEPAFTMEMPTEPVLGEPANGDLRLASLARA